MDVGISAWAELEPCDGNALLIVNSPQDDREAVARVVEQLEALAGPDALHVVADASWGPWFGGRGWPDARVRLSIDDEGRPVEINHFLESAAFLTWAVPRQFRVIAGSAPHSLNNDEVKEILEQRVCLFLGDGRFLAHTLPESYLLIFDLSCLVDRMGRHRKREAYSEMCRALVGDLYRRWSEQGKALRQDGPPVEDTANVLWRHVGRDIAAFDEVSPTRGGGRGLAESMTDLGLYVRTVLHAQAERIGEATAAFRQANADHASRIDEMTAAIRQMGEDHRERVREMTAALSERVQAVVERDAIIDDLRRRRWLARLRAWVRES